MEIAVVDVRLAETLDYGISYLRRR